MEENLFKERFVNIYNQLTLRQFSEFLTMLPNDLGNIIWVDLSLKEFKLMHDTFIELQYSENPKLDDKDIRDILVYPYK
jgi:hypothetical protein